MVEALTEGLWAAVQSIMPQAALPAKAAFLDLTETEKLESLKHLPAWLAATAQDAHRPSLQRYFERRLWQQAEPEQPKAAEPVIPGSTSAPNSVVETLPSGDLIARGEAPVLWLERGDPRWNSAADRHRREKGTTPVAHTSSYFPGNGYAFPLRYFPGVG